MLEEMLGAIATLNKVENSKQKLEEEITQLDDKTQDLLHYLEYNEFNNYYLGKIANELQSIRRTRRTKKNELALVDYLTAHSLKLNNNANREFIIQSLKKTSKETNNTRWCNRVYVEEELEIIARKEVKQ
jgi:hypothetical protein